MGGQLPARIPPPSRPSPTKGGRRNAKPFLAFTLGDPAGLGPWVSLKAALDPAVRAHCRPVLVGDAWILHRYFSDGKIRVNPIFDLDQYRGGPGLVNVLHIPHPHIRSLKLGVPQKVGGESAALSVRAAAGLAMQKRVAGVVTAPVSKESLKLAGLPYPGHTELLAHLSGAKQVEMIMTGPLGKTGAPPLAVLLTRHVPLMQAARHLSAKSIYQSLMLLNPWVRWILGGKKPRWVLCGLNPHAGDHGLIGREEIRLLAPAVKRLAARGVAVKGPLPADVAWAKTVNKNFDCVACLYHDQGMIPLKTLFPRGVVNITAGLSWVRTSPGHGTAYDLASGAKPYAGADPQATIEAARWALRLAGASA